MRTNYPKVLALIVLVALLALPSAVYAWVTHTNDVNYPSRSRPAYNAANPLSSAYTDGAFGTKIVRVTGNPGDPILINGTQNSGRNWPNHTCHQYSSNDNAWNADGSLLLLHGCDNRFGILLDGNTFKVLRVGTGGLRVWDRHDSAKWYVFSGNTVREENPRTGSGSTIMTLAGYSEITMDGHGQNASDDGRWVAVTASRGGQKVMFGIDLVDRKKGPDIPAPANLNQGENVFISASGKYLIAALGYGGKDQNIYNVQTGELLNTYRGDVTTKHPDTYQMNGRDYWVSVASGGGIGGDVFRRDLLTNEEYVYVNLGEANHVSTRNLRDGRYAIVSYEWGYSPFKKEVVAVRIDGNHRNTVRRLFHTYGDRDTYNNEIHANPTQDGKKIVYASNWTDGPTNTYVVLPPEWDTPGDGGNAGSGGTPGGSTNEVVNLYLQNGPPEEKTISMNVTKPSNAIGAELTLSGFDMDYADEGWLYINGNGPMQLFGNQKASVNQVGSTATFNTAAPWWMNGANTLRFRHVQPGGSQSNTGNHASEGYRIDSALVTFTTSGSTPATGFCNLYQSGEAPPSGYGAAWNTARSDKPLFLNSYCRADSADLRVGHGTGAQNHYVYKQGYVYRGAWQPFTLSGNFAQGSTDWLIGEGQYAFNNPPSGTTYWVGYLCQWIFAESRWRCGCRDAACTTPYWQLQGVKR